VDRAGFFGSRIQDLGYEAEQLLTAEIVTELGALHQGFDVCGSALDCHLSQDTVGDALLLRRIPLNAAHAPFDVARFSHLRDIE
jgi:hypothetical protein